MLKVVSKLLSVAIVTKFVKEVHADDENIFDTNSKFMQGFEKGWSLEENPESDMLEYGCKMPESSENSPFKNSFVMIRNSVETARQA